MPRTRPDRLDRPESRDANATHWGLFELIASLRRSLEGRNELPPEPPRPHLPARAERPSVPKRKAAD